MKKVNTKRGGFGIIYSVFIMILVATIMSYMLETGSQTSKMSLDEYIKIQNKLYEDSAIEWAILQIQNDNTKNATETYSISFENNFDFNITAREITGASGIPESNGTVMLDVIGTCTLMGSGAGEQLRTHKRLLVKP